MQFILTPDPALGVRDVCAQLLGHLSNQEQVLWLVCGGSSIPAIVSVMQALPDDLTSNLTIMLTDERYGPVGHADSNWQQLIDQGFDFKQATGLATLQPGLSAAQTVAHYAEVAKRALAKADYTITQFGIGADGHIAGILPNSVASQETEQLAAGYQTDPFLRLTLTFPALKQIDAAYAFVFGENKQPALSRLANEDLSLADQPSQILKQIPLANVYNDQMEATA